MAQKPIFINATGNGSAAIDLSHDVLTAVIVGAASTGGILAISDSVTYDSTKIVTEVDVASTKVEMGEKAKDPVTPDQAIQRVQADPEYRHENAEKLELRAVEVLVQDGWTREGAEQAVRRLLS